MIEHDVVDRTPSGSAAARSHGVAVVGAGYVGLAVAAGLAELGASVKVVDVDRGKIDQLRNGRARLFEPGLNELLGSGMRAGRLCFTTRYAEALAGAGYVMICVPTPATADGSLDTTFLRASYDEILRHASHSSLIVVNKSTVPVGTADAVAAEFAAKSIAVVANPEFLTAGSGVDNFFHPTRIVIGSRDPEAAARVAELYGPLHARILLTDPVTAELAKLAANAFLATKVSFANALAQIAQSVGADSDELLLALSLDPRIGSGHLSPGLGFGGSCLPKDLAAVEHLARTTHGSPELFRAAADVNIRQRERIVDILTSELGALAARNIAVLGIAFKANTDDVRESPGLALARRLATLGAAVRAYDPAARLPSGEPSVRAADTIAAATVGADALVIATDWPEFRELDLAATIRQMRGNLLVDGRGLLDADRMRDVGFRFFSLAGATRGSRAPARYPKLP